MAEAKYDGIHSRASRRPGIGVGFECGFGQWFLNCFRSVFVHVQRRMEARSRLGRLMEEDPVVRRMVIGTSNFTCVVAENLHLSLPCLTTALTFQHLFFTHFNFSKVERKLVSAACILAAWKACEDAEGTKDLRKLRSIPQVLYRVAVHGGEPSVYEHIAAAVATERNATGTSTHLSWLVRDTRTDKKDESTVPGGDAETSNVYDAPASYTEWILKDDGYECSQLRDRIRRYETALLRVLGYQTKPSASTFKTIDHLSRRFAAVVKSRRSGEDFLDAYGEVVWVSKSLMPYAADDGVDDAEPFTDPESLRLLKGLATSICLDTFRTPLCIEYTPTEIALACVWKAAVALQLPTVSAFAGANLPRRFAETIANATRDPTSSPPCDEGPAHRKRAPPDAAPAEEKRRRVSDDPRGASLHGVDGDAVKDVLDPQSAEEDAFDWSGRLGAKAIGGPCRVHGLLAKLRRLYEWVTEIATSQPQPVDLAGTGEQVCVSGAM
eukprot:Polyplicarium_translucidae@DN2972_c0_g1_i5.p1